MCFHHQFLPLKCKCWYFGLICSLLCHKYLEEKLEHNKNMYLFNECSSDFFILAFIQLISIFPSFPKQNFYLFNSYLKRNLSLSKGEKYGSQFLKDGGSQIISFPKGQDIRMRLRLITSEIRLITTHAQN